MKDLCIVGNYGGFERSFESRPLKEQQTPLRLIISGYDRASLAKVDLTRNQIRELRNWLNQWLEEK
jgi:hypothetical protein